jgi:hypothetical protein
MSFDARSLERLQALGRQLPQPLPRPEPSASAPSRPEQRLHAVERESDPDQLFRELMQASPDGTVPPHLLDRLRGLETARSSRPAAAESLGTPSTRQPASPARQVPRRGKSTRPSRPPVGSADDLSLYAAFEDLLHLEADEQDDGPAVAEDRQRLQPRITLQPKPTQRLGQEGR